MSSSPKGKRANARMASVIGFGGGPAHQSAAFGDAVDVGEDSVDGSTRLGKLHRVNLDPDERGDRQRPSQSRTDSTGRADGYVVEGVVRGDLLRRARPVSEGGGGVVVSANQGVGPDVQRLDAAVPGELRRQGDPEPPDASGVRQAVYVLGAVK